MVKNSFGNVRTVNRTAVGGCIDRLFLIAEGTCGLIIGNHGERCGGVLGYLVITRQDGLETVGRSGGPRFKYPRVR